MIHSMARNFSQAGMTLLMGKFDRTKESSTVFWKSNLLEIFSNGLKSARQLSRSDMR